MIFAWVSIKFSFSDVCIQCSQVSGLAMLLLGVVAGSANALDGFRSARGSGMQNCKDVFAAIVRIPVRMAMVFAFCARRCIQKVSVWVTGWWRRGQ